MPWDAMGFSHIHVPKRAKGVSLRCQGGRNQEGVLGRLQGLHAMDVLLSPSPFFVVNFREKHGENMEKVIMMEHLPEFGCSNLRKILFIPDCKARDTL